MGPPKTKPTSLNVQGYPAADLDENYSGLCAFNCNYGYYGYCPPSACATSPQPLTTPTVSPFAPPCVQKRYRERQLWWSLQLCL